MPRIGPGEDTRFPAPDIDGKLDDAVWGRAAVSGGFWCSLQNKPPSDRTEVLVVSDGGYLYFGFRLHDTLPEAITSTTTVRDVGVGYDDSITIELDTFFNRRDISTFSLNPRGTQSDQIAGGRSSKVEWKGDWLGAALRTDYGWSAEFAIPFAILNYADGETRFGANFKRYQSRTKEFSYWADVTPQGLNEEMGQLTGLELPASSWKQAWTFMPFLLAGKNIPDKEGVVQDTVVTGGVDVRYQPRPDLTAMLAVYPDFSQIEKAVTDISFSYSEKAVDENRPFFVEGADYFNSKDDDNEYFYSDRVPDFNFGGKGFGRAGRTQVGLLATQAPNDRYDFAGRMLYELDDTNSAIATVVGTSREEFDNLLAVAQVAGRQPSGLNYSLAAAYTDTRDATDPGTPKGEGWHYAGSAGWKGNYAYVNVEGDRYDREYFPADGLLDGDLPGTQGASFRLGYYREMAHPVWQVIQGYAGATYRETTGGHKQSQKVFVSGSVELNQDIRVGLYHDEGPYRPVTDVRGVFEDTFNEDRYSSATLDFNTRSTHFSGGVQYDWGDLGGGDYRYYLAYGWWRPVDPLYLKVSAERTDSFGITDQVVATASWDITPENTLAGRYVYNEDIQYYRAAYAYRPRRGLDIFLVYEDDSSREAEYSVKVVIAF